MSEQTIGDLVEQLPPGEPVRFGGFVITRWPDEPPVPAKADEREGAATE